MRGRLRQLGSLAMQAPAQRVMVWATAFRRQGQRWHSTHGPCEATRRLRTMTGAGCRLLVGVSSGASARDNGRDAPHASARQRYASEQQWQSPAATSASSQCKGGAAHCLCVTARSAGAATEEPGDAHSAHEHPLSARDFVTCVASTRGSTLVRDPQRRLQSKSQRVPARLS